MNIRIRPYHKTDLPNVLKLNARVKPYRPAITSIEAMKARAQQAQAADDPRWEKPCSAEYFYHPDYDGPYRVGNGFQIDCGVAINGSPRSSASAARSPSLRRR